MKYFFILGIILISCSSQVEQPVTIQHESNNEVAEQQVPLDSLKKFDRSRIRQKIDSVQKVGGDLFVHCLVPLCDNENQGIVPVSKSLGDGLNLRTNLYWATGHGMRGYFKKSADWKHLKTYVPEDANILERCLFVTKVGNANVYLVTDAYRGDRMKECLDDYFASLAGKKLDTMHFNNKIIQLNGNSNMVAFNGHNGLMDNEVKAVTTVRNQEIDASAIGCITVSYFKYYFFQSRAYPLVMTTGLMYPGAFILDDIIKKWAVNRSEEEISNAAGDAYNRIMKCGQRAGRNLFTTGW